MAKSILSFLTGILIVQQWRSLPDDFWLVGIGLITMLLAWLSYWRCFLFFIGMLWATIFAMHQLGQQLPKELAGLDLRLEGYVTNLPDHEDKDTRFNFKVTNANRLVPETLRLTWYHPNQEIKAGQGWAFTVRLKRPHGNANPGGFDYERWLFTEGIGATGYVRDKPAPVRITHIKHNNPLTYRLLIWRQAISDHLAAVIPDKDTLPLIKALTIGDGDSLTPWQWEVFRKTGTTHLMVISGSHIGLIAGLVYLLVIRLWAWSGIMALSPQKVAAILAVVSTFFYAGITGFSVPAQRAAIMVTIAMFSVVQQRNTRPYHILAIALFAVLLIDPLIVLSIGFWLSFCAVGLIIYVMVGRLKKPGLVLGGFKINWVTSVGLAPLLLFFFQQVSLIAPVANFIAVPVVGLIIVPLALLSTLAMFVTPDLATKLFVLVSLSLQGLWWVLLKLSSLPLSTFNHSQPSTWALIMASLGILLLFSPKGMPSRWLGMIMLLPLLFTAKTNIKPGAFKLTLLDVGQGLSVVAQTSNHSLIYDTGTKYSSSSDAGQNIILPYLHHEGIDKVDSLIISHGDNDHIGGTKTLLAEHNINNLLTSVPQMLPDYQPTLCQSGQTWTWDEVRFTILSPQANLLHSENDNSCVLQIQARQGAALLTGDIEATAEEWLVNTYGNQLRSDVMIAPHHGSQTSSTKKFLQAVSPQLVLIPAGYRNPFGHPHKTVLNRYRNMAIKWLNSADSGAIQLTVDNHLKVESWRTKEDKYWNFKD